MSRKRFWPEPTITGLYLANFKGFGPDGCHIPLRPLTLIYGPNSGGKSTLLKGFSSIAQSKVQSMSEGTKQAWVSEGPWFDLGSKKQVMHQQKGQKSPEEFTIGYSSSNHDTLWDNIKPSVWETGVPVLNLTEESETMKRIEEIFDLFDAEGYEGLISSIENFGEETRFPLHSAVFLDLLKDNPHYENDLQAYSYDWPEGFKHSCDDSPDLELLKSNIWTILLGSLLSYFAALQKPNSPSSQEDSVGTNIDDADPTREFLRALDALHVSDITETHARIQFHYDSDKARQLNTVWGKTSENHAFSSLRVDLDMLRKLIEGKIGLEDTNPESGAFQFVGPQVGAWVGGPLGPVSSMVFDLPANLSKNQILLLQIPGGGHRTNHSFALSPNSDYTMEELIESNILHTTYESKFVDDWIIKEDKLLIKSRSTSAFHFTLYIGKIALRENRLNFTFSHTSSGYSLKGFDYHDLRHGSWHKLISGKSTELDLSSREDYGQYAIDPGQETVFLTTFHPVPSVRDPAKIVYTPDSELSYSKAAKKVSKVVFPLFYTCNFNEKEDTLELSRVREFQEGQSNPFLEDVRSKTDNNITAESFIELVDVHYSSSSFNPLTKLEKEAIQTFFTGGNKDKYQISNLKNIVRPKKKEANIPDNFDRELGTCSRAKMVSLFGIDDRYLKPRVRISVGLDEHTDWKWASHVRVVSPSNHFDALYQLQKVLNLIILETSRTDYLSASRLAPRRYYAQADHSSSASASGRTLANLNTKFPRGSPNLAKLNELMARIVGMEVSFGKLRSTDGQETNLLDIRVGRPGSSRRKFAQLPDVGYGVSQTLPLVAAIVDTGESSPDTTLVIEEAESNLHPAAQSRLMDAILENLNTDTPSPKIVLETHSEHFLMTVQRHLREGDLDIKDEDIAILYVDNDNPEGTTEVHHMETRKGDFLSPWPRENWDDPTSPII